MKIHCKKADLLRGVQTIQSALSARTTLPILLNFLLETEKSKVKLVSTDLEMGMKHYIPAEVESDGSITIPARKFSDIIGSLTEDKDVDLAVDAGGRVQVRSGRSRFSLAGAPKSEYPVLPEFNPEGAFSLKRDVLAGMLKQTVFAASSDETRYVLNGVFWAGAGGTLDLVATDGRRLARASRACLPQDREFRAIVPTKVLSELARLLNSAEGDDGSAVKVAVTENQIAFQFGTTTLLSRLVEGSFPNYEQVIPSKRDVKIVVPTEQLMAITKRASLCAADRGGAVRFTFAPRMLQVHASSQNQEFDEEMPLDFQGPEFVTAFNPQFVLEGLKAMGADKVQWGFTTPANPALLESPEDAGYQYVVMPMRS